ncbi:MAG: hypothetical protein O9322_02880 [Beijerinckiaceae bacterium]|nr:hypothetical protein [Beijerinckiaceae bacterium]MCZ8301509.1 hypothetical protein [Beijerinckiaceae bacterium]
MLITNDQRLMEDQLVTLSMRAERFAAVFGRITPGLLPSGAPQGNWLASLTSRAETPHGFLAELLVAACEQAGMRYSPEICASMGIALLDTLQEVIGDGFTGPARSAWSSAFALVSDGIEEAA